MFVTVGGLQNQVQSLWLGTKSFSSHFLPPYAPFSTPSHQSSSTVGSFALVLLVPLFRDNLLFFLHVVNCTSFEVSSKVNSCVNASFIFPGRITAPKGLLISSEVHMTIYSTYHICVYISSK